MSGTQSDHGQHTTDAGSPPDQTVVKMPPLTIPHPLLRSLPPMTHLPSDLFDLLNQAYFLHILANDPSRVLPPGKSLLSALSQPHVRQRRDDEPATLQEKVEEMIHKAFWDEVPYRSKGTYPLLILRFYQALDALSSTEPSTQLPRLTLLFKDLRAALLPVLPAEHPVLAILSEPLPPTSSPLLTTANHFREVLIALRERCAPARDAYIDSLSTSLTDPPSDIPGLAKLVIEAARSLLKLAEVMKDDLSQFVLGTMGEAQLAAAIADQARTQERALVLDLWKQKTIHEDIAAWLANLSQPDPLMVTPPSRKWVLRLMQALGATDPVACPLPTKPLALEDTVLSPVPNTLPPPFFFSTPELFYIQNVLQAIVIAAVLRTLLPASESPPSDIMYRIWTLLLASVNEENHAEDARLVNLADELIRASSLTDTDPDAKKLRAAVARTVRTADPVFLLLQRRLLSALAKRLVRTSVPVSREDVPTGMRTGRREGLPNTPEERETETEVLDVQGFGDPALIEAMRDVLGRLRGTVLWIEGIWRDAFEPRNTE
jgi:T-complex protein 11